MEIRTLPYTSLNTSTEVATRRQVEIYTDLYRVPSHPETREPIRVLPVIVLTMLSITLSVCLVVSTIAQSGLTAAATIEIRGEYGDEWEYNIQDKSNDRPIIGVLSQEVDDWLLSKLPPASNYTSYISASYVKWIESGGARVVPIIIGRPREYYKELFAGLNGLLLPGGSANLTGSGGYAEIGQLFFHWAKKANDAGDYFPIWGTCNGFELLTVVSLKDDQSRLTDCYSEDQAVPLVLRGDWRQSRIYGQAPDHIIRDLTKKPVTINFHHFCLTPTNFTKFGLHRFWNALSVNRDSFDLEYISTIEAKNYPFIGVQFHPEKNVFEWNIKQENIPHNQAAINVASYLSRFMVNQSRRSQHKFSNEGREYMIYNYDSTYTGSQKIDISFEQAYFF